MKRIIKVGTRTSKLALAQTKLVTDKISTTNPDIKFEIVSINTKGDQVHHKPLRDVFEEGKGAFTSEIQQALKRGQIDIAVHSMKDVAGNIKESELAFGAFLERDSAADVIILKTDEYKSLKDIPDGFAIGTVSARRKAALLRANPNFIPKNLRGNVQTRIEKLKGTHTWTTHKILTYDAILMAKSAIVRSGDSLDLDGLFYFDIPATQMLPAAGQGTIGVECRKNDPEIYGLLRKINHERTERETMAEREFLYELGGNCHTVIGVFAEEKNGQINISAEISDENGGNLFTIINSGKNEPEELGRQTAKSLKEKIRKDKGDKFLSEVLHLSQK